MILILILFSLKSLLSWHYRRPVILRRAQNIWKRLRKAPLRFPSVVDLQVFYQLVVSLTEQSRYGWEMWFVRKFEEVKKIYLIFIVISEMAMSPLAWRARDSDVWGMLASDSNSKCLESKEQTKVARYSGSMPICIFLDAWFLPVLRFCNITYVESTSWYLG